MFFLLVLLFLANFLFALAPLFVGDLQGFSTYSIAFFRFFTASIVEFLIIWIVIKRIQKQVLKDGQKVKFVAFSKLLWKKFYMAKNRQFFRGKRNIVYFSVLGILVVNLSVPFYFLSFTTAGLVISTIMVNGFALLIIAFNNWRKGEERMDMLKILDIILLMAAIFTIAYSSFQSPSGSLSLFSGTILTICIIAYTSFLIFIGNDSSAFSSLMDEFDPPSTADWGKLEEIFLLLRALLKVATFHLVGSLVLIPFTLLLHAVSPDSLVGGLAGDFIYHDITHFFRLAFEPHILALVIICTVLPYFFITYSTIKWPKRASKHDMWASIFTLIDPLMGLYIGYFIWQEDIRADYIVFTTLFLGAGIVIRFFHGNMNTRQFVFMVKLKPSEIENFLKYMEKIHEIDEISFLLGTYDFMIEVTVHSMARLAKIADRINYFAGLEEAYYSVRESIL